MRGARYLDLFVDRRQQSDGVARLIPDMAIVKAAPLARFSGERDDLIGLGKALRGIEQPGRKPDRALAHCACDQRLHLAQFLRSWRALGLADHALADRAEAGIGGIIDPDRARPRAVQHASNVNFAAAVIADERGCHALHQEHRDQPLGGIVRRQIVPHMRMRIDEAGRDDHAMRVDHARGGARHMRRDLDDMVPLNRHVANERRVGPGIDSAAAQDQVCGRRGRSADCSERHADQ